MLERLARLVPPGTSRGKLLAVAVLVPAALGVLAYDAVWLFSDAPDWPVVEEVHALEAAPASLVPQPGPSATRPDEVAAGTGTPPAAPAAATAEPDWAALFGRLMERSLELESATGGGSGNASHGDLPQRLAAMRLTGLVAGEQGVALVDGRLLRVGDALPGTRLVISSIRRDRVLLAEAGRATSHELLLDGLSAAPRGEQP